MEREEAIEVVKKNYPHVNESGSQFETALRTLIPELAESKDEKIRQFLIHEVTETSGKIMSYRNMNKKDVLAWLEKQGKQKPTDIQSIEKRAHEVFPDDNDENTPLYRQAFIDGAVDYIDCGCKNTAWSEEDERMKNQLVDFMWSGIDISKAPYGCVAWLKSLKDRYTWKPSDEQMKALSAINVTGGISYAGQGQELINLYNDLKTLKLW